MVKPGHGPMSFGVRWKAARPRHRFESGAERRTPWHPFMVPTRFRSMANHPAHEPPLTPSPSPVRRERVARAPLEPGEGLPSGRFMDPMRGKSLAINALPEPPSRQQLAASRLAAARAALADCRLCVHDCGVDRRAGPAGLCHAGSEARFFSAQTEAGDELALLPTFAIALSGCNLRCDFCITGASSWNPRAGVDVDAATLGDRARDALARSARSVMILGGEPTIHLPALLELVAALPDDARLVLKTNGCFSPTARPLLAGLFDVWLPDFKFGNDTCAHRLAGVAGYWAALTSNLAWLAGQAAAA